MHETDPALKKRPGFLLTLAFFGFAVLGILLIVIGAAAGTDRPPISFIVGIVVYNVGFWGTLYRISLHLKWKFSGRHYGRTIRTIILGVCTLGYFLALSWMLSQFLSVSSTLKDKKICARFSHLPTCFTDLNQLEIAVRSYLKENQEIEIMDTSGNSENSRPDGSIQCTATVKPLHSSKRIRIVYEWSCVTGQFAVKRNSFGD